MANSYESGDLIRISATFTNDAGAATDPTSVTFELAPYGAPAMLYLYPSSSLVKDSTGVYHGDFIPAPGNYTYAIKGTGAVQRTVTGAFYVKQSVP